MAFDRILVLILGITLMILSTWFFFGPKKTGKAKISKSGIQEIDILVKGGYDPSIISAQPDLPIRIDFDRQEASDCSARIVFPDLGISRGLSLVDDFISKYHQILSDLPQIEPSPIRSVMDLARRQFDGIVAR
ncbi:MAG: hypothetical protein ACE5OZ_25925 [Candidatus Heimdallarchaeota archaeon]